MFLLAIHTCVYRLCEVLCANMLIMFNYLSTESTKYAIDKIEKDARWSQGWHWLFALKRFEVVINFIPLLIGYVKN